MKKQIVLLGIVGGAMIALLRLIEYRFLVIEHSVEIYGGLVALLFASMGIWLGLKLTNKREIIVVEKPQPPVEVGPFRRNDKEVVDSGITKRELEILQLIADGLSNREIAQALFVSENTVKTHSSRIFEKLEAKRRTQAVQIAKERGLIP